MRTEMVEYHVYKFNELEDKVQQKVLENLSDINVDCEWWSECTIEDYTAKLAEIGFEDAKIYLSGFCSQGDGACFDARINLEKIIKHIGDKKFNRLVKLWHNGYLGMTIERNSYANHYCHQRTRYIDMERFTSDRHRRLDALCELLKDYVAELRLELSTEIYRALEKDYDYLTSKEAIIETIEANEYEFLSTGKIF